MTPHIHAKVGDFAKTVLMPGDPLRAKFIAETYLEDVREISNVRNILAYTGKYQGKPVSVMASGMGMPSIGIYSWELFSVFGVENIIRVGSCGAYTEALQLHDVLLAEKVWSESTFAQTQNGEASPFNAPSTILNQYLTESAKRARTKIHHAIIHSSDVFYRNDHMSFKKIYQEVGAVAVEMESFALFHNARTLNKHAACLLTVSDHLLTNEATTSSKRETGFTQMIEIALGSLQDCA
ncbi:purine-nucleoside phosphorylase, DeoD family [Idiomarina sp. A28L]|uniref:purine-nucleoside phosphorylase n=1 Tax=Idiomarina sp. A28L TaxID=1036674 RepID=UPI0002138C2C|nr:purine-nucleoside phosphorylase [Idiomarina sp. A28L]EGN75430.1 purine-nucleoside phosphorylase, DeoD family [Idiomarina sp. A28L]